LEIRGRDECLRLLATRTIGRVGLTVSALPVVLPVNYWFNGEDVLVRTSWGTKLEAAMRNAVVAFEVDDIDRFEHTGWSVLATGKSRPVVDEEELDRLRHAPLARWAPQGREQLMAIDTRIVSGRRIHPGLHP
jgi:nitroimidazol reductase NimA-like FMN-containing flavoprotein (pyridoxamine 5'-phosphate oxidase superfamily)